MTTLINASNKTTEKALKFGEPFKSAVLKGLDIIR